MEPTILADVGHTVEPPNDLTLSLLRDLGWFSDFDGVPCTPQGLEDVSKFPNLTRALLEKGYTAADVRKIYGGNFLRVMRAVEAAAGR